MSLVRAWLGWAVALAVLAVLTACAASERPTWVGSGADVRIQAREYSFGALPRVHPGVVGLRLANTGEEPHQATIFRLRRGVSVAEAVDTFRGDPSGGEAAALMSPTGGVNTVLPGRTQRVALRLGAGAYAVFCFVRGGDGQLHAQRGMVAGLTVAGVAARSSPPRVTGTVVLRDSSIEAPPALSTPQATLRVRNEGARLHELALLRLPGERTVADLSTWLNDVSRGAAAGPAPFLEAGGITALPPGGEAWFRTDFGRGPHVAVSFAAAADGRADALSGLLAPFAVP